MLLFAFTLQGLAFTPQGLVFTPQGLAFVCFYTTGLAFTPLVFPDASAELFNQSVRTTYVIEFLGRHGRTLTFASLVLIYNKVLVRDNALMCTYACDLCICTCARVPV